MADRKFNPFESDETANQETLLMRLANEGALNRPGYGSAVIRTFIDYVHSDYFTGLDLVSKWLEACLWNSSSGPGELPASEGGIPLFPEVVQFMGLDRDVVETALAVYAAIDPRYVYAPPQPF